MTTRPERIDPEAAAELFEENRAVFVDARPPAAHREALYRIPGAVRIEPGSGAHMDAAILALPRELTLIAYCDEPGEAASAQVARRHRELGHGDGLVLSGGLRAWRAMGFPTEPLTPLDADPAVFDTFSDEDLMTLCHIVFRTDLLPGRGRPHDWGVAYFGHEQHLDRLSGSREAAIAYLAGVRRSLVDRYNEFVHVQGVVNVPADHDVRVANLPPDMTAKGPLHPDESLALLRWITWNVALPLRREWWDSTPGYQ